MRGLKLHARVNDTISGEISVDRIVLSARMWLYAVVAVCGFAVSGVGFHYRTVSEIKAEVNAKTTWAIAKSDSLISIHREKDHATLYKSETGESVNVRIRRLEDRVSELELTNREILSKLNNLEALVSKTSEQADVINSDIKDILKRLPVK